VHFTHACSKSLCDVSCYIREELSHIAIGGKLLGEDQPHPVWTRGYPPNQKSKESEHQGPTIGHQLQRMESAPIILVVVVMGTRSSIDFRLELFSLLSVACGIITVAIVFLM